MKGAKIVGIVEREGSLFNAEGIDIGVAMSHFKGKGSLKNFQQENTHFLTDECEALELPCDIFVAAAVESAITRFNAPNIKARMIVEAAHFPTTPAAEEILLKRGIFIIPDILGASGAINASYFEYLKNLSHVRFGRMTKRYEESKWTLLLSSFEKLQNIPQVDRDKILYGASEEDLVTYSLEEGISYTFQKCMEVSESKNIDLRTAAYLIGINDVGSGYLDLGL